MKKYCRYIVTIQMIEVLLFQNIYMYVSRERFIVKKLHTEIIRYMDDRRQGQFNLLVNGQNRSNFKQKRKSNITKFWLIRFFKIFYSMCLIYYLRFLDKTYNNQNQEGFIICQKKPPEVFCKKWWSWKCWKFNKKTAMLEFIFVGVYASRDFRRSMKSFEVNYWIVIEAGTRNFHGSYSDKLNAKFL